MSRVIFLYFLQITVPARPRLGDEARCENEKSQLPMQNIKTSDIGYVWQPNTTKFILDK